MKNNIVIYTSKDGIIRVRRNSIVKNFLTVQKEGQREVKRDVIHYNLDAIIAVGYRINFKRATEFRIWATRILKDIIVEFFLYLTKR